MALKRIQSGPDCAEAGNESTSRTTKSSFFIRFYASFILGTVSIRISNTDSKQGNAHLTFFRISGVSSLLTAAKLQIKFVPLHCF